MQRLGNSLQRFVSNVPALQKNVQANLSNFIQDLFWRERFSNEDFKMVEGWPLKTQLLKPHRSLSVCIFFAHQMEGDMSIYVMPPTDH